jgi:anaerobic ribonucleoside-triphosphate reductase activating protein
VLWLQGCGLGCPSCWNQAGLPFTGTPTDGQEIVGRVLALQRARMIEGLTFSGGEPMQQALSLLGLIERMRDSSGADLSFGMFTGYTLGELERGGILSSRDAEIRRQSGERSTLIWISP